MKKSTMELLSQSLAECIAAFTLVFLGVSSIALGLPAVQVALAHGIAILIMVFAIGPISGAHINPAVTIAMAVTHQITRTKALFYIIGQLFGAILGIYALAALFAAAVVNVNAGLPQLAAGVSPLMGIFIEGLMTFLLVFVIFGATSKLAPKGVAGIPIGLTIFVNILWGGIFTGAAMNPARAFGPAVFMNTWTNQWIYWVGPIAGGLLAAILYKSIENLVEPRP